MPDKKITEFEQTVSPNDLDLLPIVTDVNTVPATKTITVSDLFAPIQTTLKKVPAVIEGRLTLYSGVPVTLNDFTNGTTLYYTPYNGNKIALYNGSEWNLYTFTERSISLAGTSANTNYDVYIYDNSGTLTLELFSWTDPATRPLAYFDSVFVKGSERNKRYLGTIRTTSTAGQCEDSYAKRFVWNYYNRIQRYCYTYSGGSGAHTYITSTWRSYNNDATIKTEFVVGEYVPAQLFVMGEFAAGYVGLGMDSVANTGIHILRNAGTSLIRAGSNWMEVVPVGLNTHYMCEYGTTGGNFQSCYICTMFGG